jgi:hypothetical protein
MEMKYMAMTSCMIVEENLKENEIFSDDILLEVPF